VNEVSFHPIDDPGIARAWDELAQATAAGPFARHRWFSAWARAFEAQVEVAAVHGSDAFAAVIRRGGRLRAPVNEESPEFEIVAVTPSARDRLIRGILIEGNTSCDFLKVGREFSDAIRNAAADRRVSEEVIQRSPYLELTGDWDSYEGSLSPSFRQGLRRKGRRLQNEGEVAVECYDGRENLEELFREGLEVESSRWKAEQGTAIASRVETRDFYEAIARWLSEEEALRLWFLRVAGAPLAFRMDLIVEGVYYHLKGGYDPVSARFSPGLLLQHETVRHAFQQGLARYEFLGADEAYKMNWTKACRDRIALRIFGSGIRGRVAWLERAVARPLVKRILRHNPKA